MEVSDLALKAMFLAVLILFSTAVTIGIALSFNVVNLVNATSAPNSREPQILRDPIDSDGPGATASKSAGKLK